MPLAPDELRMSGDLRSGPIAGVRLGAVRREWCWCGRSGESVWFLYVNPRSSNRRTGVVATSLCRGRDKGDCPGVAATRGSRLPESAACRIASKGPRDSLRHARRLGRQWFAVKWFACRLGVGVGSAEIDQWLRRLAFVEPGWGVCLYSGGGARVTPGARNRLRFGGDSGSMVNPCWWTTMWW